MAQREIINVDDVFPDRPRLSTTLYIALGVHVFIAWGSYGASDEPVMLLTAWLLLAITMVFSYTAWLMLTFKQRHNAAIGRYIEYLSSLDKPALRYLLNDSRLRPFSANIVHHHYAVRFGIDDPD